MSDPFKVWEKARRSGGLKFHPKTEDNMGMSAPKGPGFFSSIISKSWEWLKANGFGLLALIVGAVAATYAIKAFNKPSSSTYHEPTPVLTESEQSPAPTGHLDKIMVDGFKGVAVHLNTLSGNISELIAELRANKAANPDRGIAPEPKIIPVRHRVEVRIPNPINKQLRNENARLRNEMAGLQSKLMGLEHDYKLNQKIIDDFYKVPIQPGYKRTLTHYGKCPPVDNNPSPTSMR